MFVAFKGRSLALAVLLCSGGCGEAAEHAADTGETGASCWSCHDALFEATTDPDHRGDGFSQDCAQCHGTQAWRPARFDDHARVWPLGGAHVTVDCAGCHADRPYSGTPRDCEGCHQADAAATTHPPHLAGGYPTTCASCHNDTAWRPAEFDHGVFWPLVGQHAQAECASCHQGGGYADTPSDCVACHQANYAGTTDPNHALSGFPTSCAACHAATGWRPASYAGHDLYWALEGRHEETACTACHLGETFTDAPRDCQGCHQPDFDATTRPNHVSESIPNTCAACHTPNGWSPAGFEAHDGSWPLEGKHAEVSCAACHQDGTYAGTPRACDACHTGDWVAATEPDHDAGGYPVDCALCHTPAGWTPSPFDHDAEWRLAGKHLLTHCTDCHAGGTYAGTARNCRGCHEAEYDATVAPPHASANIGKDCTRCHTPAGWAPAELDHAPYWPLTGKHREPQCADCHIANVYAGTPETCEGCHLPDYQASVEPPHAALGYPTDCAQCHTSATWAPASFNHEAIWPLNGQHVTTSCAACHVGGEFAGTPSACTGCHQPELDATAAPRHVNAGFTGDCTACHTEQAWTPSSFDHAPIWPLTGQHRDESCTACHVNEVYIATSDACASCHQADYTGTTAPKHTLAGYSQDCASCHTEGAWLPATLTHPTSWPLTGKHTLVACSDCHQGDVYAGTPTACDACHHGDYLAATAPPHASGGFGTNCATCHTTATWGDGTFDHATWPLTGAHTAATCAACHAGGVTTGTATTCNGCHQPDYVGAASPSHTALNLGTACQSCHTTANWDTTTFPAHDPLFRLSSGKHRSYTCAQCHLNASVTWSTFTCTGCHTGAHQLTKMNTKHNGVNNYASTLASAGSNDRGCHQCHPSGQE